MATMNVELTQEEIAEAVAQYVERKFNVKPAPAFGGADEAVVFTVKPRYSGPREEKVGNIVTAKIAVEAMK
jgi:hypothetical protein